MTELPQTDSGHRHAHRRQAVRRHAQRHHWHFYKNRADWSFVQNFARAPIRWGQERSVLAAAAGLLALLAFVVLPGWASVVRPESAAAGWTAAPIALPPPAPLPALAGMPVDDWQRVDIRNGQTLGDIFQAAGLGATVMHQVIDGNARVQALARRMRPGDSIGFHVGPGGDFKAMRFDADETTRVVLRRAPDGAILEEVQARPVERRVLMAGGRIEDSLFGAGEEAGLSDAMTMRLADVFAYDIDFAQDLRRGDRFTVMYEEIYREGEKINGGAILAASFFNRGKEYRAIRFTRDDGSLGYFDGSGRGLRKAFLRTPLEFTRISSRFNSARRHPILGTVRAHRGVDYAAPRGTPVKAAGAGKVAYRGWKSGYGNVVIIEHANKYSTLYGHLSSFSGIRQGARVEQGQSIGYVGMTGLATAPHLHYEFRLNGVHRDPLSIELPKSDPLGPAELSRFRRASAPLFAQLGMLGQRADLAVR